MLGNRFTDLRLNSWIIRQLDELGIQKPTPIQEHCIPEILKGKDCIGAAKTGSGKTMAFALPILQKLSEDPYGIFAVVLTPTRELAFQIGDTFDIIGKVIKLRHCVVVGGMDMIEQGKELARKPHVVIATPGRLCDHLKSCNTFSLKRVKFLVLDEADRLLGGAFDDQVKLIFQASPKQKQVLLFSATINDTLQKVREVTSSDVFLWEQKAEVATVEKLKQYYILCPGYVKDAYLVETIREFLKENEEALIMVFTDTCKNCQLLSMTLNNVGFINVALHGMIAQKERLNSLNKFKSRQIRMLIATDVASRGLDIPEVELILNHNIPSAAKDYVHRVGRTARAGKSGFAISLVSPSDLNLLKSIEESINTSLEAYNIDSKEVAKIFTQISVTKREAEIKLDQRDFYERKSVNKRKQLILEGKILQNDDTNVFLKNKKNKKVKRNSKVLTV